MTDKNVIKPQRLKRTKGKFYTVDYEALPSKIFHPLTVLPVSGVLILFFNGLNIFESGSWIFLWILSAMVPTAAVAWRTGERGFDVVSREQRKKSYIVGAASLTFGLALSIFLGAPAAVVNLGYFAVGAVLVFGLVNSFRKVSVHTGTLGFVAGGFLNTVPLISVLCVVLAVPVGWSRVELDQHSRDQVVQGAVVGFLCGLIAALV